MAASATDRRVPLGWCLAAAWAFDLTGIGHWLPAAAAFAVIAYAVGARRWDPKAGLVLAVTVLSHDVLDLVVGLQVLPGGEYLGANLSGRSLVELALELVLIVGGWLVYRSSLPEDARAAPTLLVPLGVMLLATAAHFATAPDVEEDSGTVQLLILVVGLAASWIALVWANRRVRPNRV